MGLLESISQAGNEFGRFLDELLDKREIAARGEEAGLIPAEREVRIQVSHESFKRDYFVDLLLCHGLLVEAKTVEEFAPVHRAEALNYLLLMGLHHGTLINLRATKVEQEFVSTRLTPERRRNFTVTDEDWKATGERSELMKEKLIALLHDWGAFLGIGLYREALAYFLGGEAAMVKRVSVCSGQRVLGEQAVHLLDPETAMAVSAVTGDGKGMRHHQERFLRHTPLRVIQWANLNHNRIEFSTLFRK